MLPPDAFTTCLHHNGENQLFFQDLLEMHVGMMVFCALGKQHVSFPCLDSCSVTVLLVALLRLHLILRSNDSRGYNFTWSPT